MTRDDALLEELSASLTQAIGAVRVLRHATLLLARRSGPEDAERLLLRLAIRHGHELGPKPPLTGTRLGLWRCWSGYGVWRGVDALKPRPRWAFVRARFAALTPEALREVELVDGRANEEAELELAERDTRGAAA